MGDFQGAIRDKTTACLCQGKEKRCIYYIPATDREGDQERDSREYIEPE
jgi:hypothetical protein